MKKTLRNAAPKSLGLDQPAIYHIAVSGRLGAGWAENFSSLKQREETHNNGGIVTHLEGMIQDQSQLHGILAAIRDANLPLLLVQRLDNQA